MTAATPAIAALPSAPAWRKALLWGALNLGLWILLSILGTLTSLNEDLRQGVQGDYWLIFLSSARTALTLAVLGTVLYLVFRRWPARVASARAIGLGYLVLLLLLLPTQMLFLMKLALHESGPGLSWAAIESQVESIGRLAPLLHWTSLTAVYFSVVALALWQQNLARTSAWARAQADALALRLALEQQHSLALRAQLEPHFMFNALNAISALVRSDDKEVALEGIEGLSELLRYALAASGREWVSLGEELAFIADYLSLQRMRYGARMQVSIEGATADVLEAECPPLLLQPLVENALRHDLDCHTSASDICIVFERSGGQIVVRVSNPVHAGAGHNPGVGLGLRNVEQRLRLAYGPAAEIRTALAEGRFVVTLRMPLHGAD